MADTDIETRDDGYKETDVDGWPGWKRIISGNNRRYRSPGGLEISNARWVKLVQQYKSQGFIPENEILPPSEDTSRPKPKFFTKEEMAAAEPEQPKSYSEIVTSIKPSARPTSPKRKKPTAIALAIGFKMLFLLITTGILVRLLQDERAAMTEQEATVLGNALGNLLEPTGWNEQWGWLVAETGDWQAVGYVAISYVGRLSDIGRERQMTRRAMRQNNMQQPMPMQTVPRQHQAPAPPAPTPPAAQQAYSPESNSTGTNGNGFLRMNDRPSGIPYRGEGY